MHKIQGVATSKNISMNPICSMYGIFIYTYIWLKCMVKVSKYFIHGAYGYVKLPTTWNFYCRAMAELAQCLPEKFLPLPPFLQELCYVSFRKWAQKAVGEITQVIRLTWPMAKL